MASNLPNKITGPWTLKDLREGQLGAPKHGLKVFSTFACGGGSTMGYKLAGYDVLGCCEIDPEMAGIYRENHHPKYLYQMPIQDMKSMPELPSELFDLDILDGSPPCSSFSMAGSREDAWGEKKKFREGQTVQILDDLFFHFIDLGRRIQPKVMIAENVKGLIQGAAKGYVKEIFTAFRTAGYEVQLFLLNASRMGVPQKRERVFFIAQRNDLALSPIKLSFYENPITVKQALLGTNSTGARILRPSLAKYWSQIPAGKSVSHVNETGSSFCRVKIDPKMPSNTLNADLPPMHWKEMRHLSPSEIVRIQSFPDDYNFLTQDSGYVCGMSVPPLMMQRVALAVASQWLLNPTP